MNRSGFRVTSKYRIMRYNHTPVLLSPPPPPLELAERPKLPKGVTGEGAAFQGTFRKFGVLFIMFCETGSVYGAVEPGLDNGH